MNRKEAKAFDRRIYERVRHGHLPDLRRVQPCDWFYNNPWRRPYLVSMVFGRYFRFALRHTIGKTLLEVGSGPGHMSLEFAREGFHVLGIDVSPASVEVARQVAAENPFQDGFGSLEYVVADFLAWTPTQTFDNICFFGTLHHFDRLADVLAKVNDLLNPNGRLIVIEPARDWLTLKDAAIIALIRWLLAWHSSWYEKLPLPASEAEIDAYVHECLREYQEARDRNEPKQSPDDNASFATEMLSALRSRFEQIAFEPGFSFFPRIGGGVRGRTEDEAQKLSEFLCLFDQYAVTAGLMNPGGFLWAGQAIRGS